MFLFPVEVLTFSDFETGWPRMGAYGYSRCLVLHLTPSGTSYKWRDTSCNTEHHTICQLGGWRHSFFSKTDHAAKIICEKRKKTFVEFAEISDEDKCRPYPCANDAPCRNVNDTFVCDCPQGFTGTTCLISKWKFYVEFN